MSKITVKRGAASMRHCAFCEYWYDPTNSVISPKQGLRDVWEYESGIKKTCTEFSNQPRASQSSCPKFSCKL